MENLNIKLQEQFYKMCATGKLFRANITGLKVWEVYLEGFGNDPKFRHPDSSVHNCNHCNNFIRRYGNIVALDENLNIMTIFDVSTTEEYQNSMNEMSKKISSRGIKDVFFETFNELNSLPYEFCKRSASEFKLGVDKNIKRYTREEAEKFGVVKPNEIRIFHHFSLQLPSAFVDKSGKSVESLIGDYRSAKEVFKRAMDEIPADTLELVKDLINQGSLLNGAAHLHKAEAILKLKKSYDEVPANLRDRWCWKASYKLNLAKFKNELIGVLCSELAEGEELNKACQAWNKRVDPANYMKAVAPITETQKKNARKFVEENGYVDSFDRRAAVLDDIKADEIKHMNVGDGEIKSGSIFDGVRVTKARHKRNEFDGVQEVPVETFMRDILPTCTSIEAFVENRHEGNFVTMTTSNNEDCKPMFKWNNPYSWTYKGNLAGKSQIKENVSKVGGNINAIVRCSLQWNDEDTPGIVDFDLHSKGSNYIFYQNKGKTHGCGGHLDVDMIRPSKIGIENITWKNKIADGVYNIGVKNYCGANNSGFKVEIEFGDEVFNYVVNRNCKGYTEVAAITVRNGEISIEHRLPSVNASKEIYGIETKNFHKVNLVCLSPNHWGDNNVGNKHYFFMLEDCKFDSSIRSFHNENLSADLAQHRKVLEVLGAVNTIEPSDRQLSGLGFNATVRDEVILKLKGSFKRVVKVRF